MSEYYDRQRYALELAVARLDRLKARGHDGKAIAYTENRIAELKARLAGPDVPRGRIAPSTVIG